MVQIKSGPKVDLHCVSVSRKGFQGLTIDNTVNFLIHLVIRENNPPSQAQIQWAIVGSRDVSFFLEDYSQCISSFIISKPWIWKRSLRFWMTKMYKNGLFIFVNCVKLKLTTFWCVLMHTFSKGFVWISNVYNPREILKSPQKLSFVNPWLSLICWIILSYTV